MLFYYISNNKQINKYHTTPQNFYVNIASVHTRQIQFVPSTNFQQHVHYTQILSVCNFWILSRFKQIIVKFHILVSFNTISNENLYIYTD